MNISPRSAVPTGGCLFSETTRSGSIDQLNDLLAEVEASMLARFDSPGIVNQALTDHLQSGGGRFRARLALDAGLKLALPEDDCVAIAASIELLHNASLVHDDLQDQDRERRGRPSLWAKYGSDTALLAGDLMLASAYAALAESGGKVSRLIQAMHQRVGLLIHGQIEDLHADPGSTVSVEDYERIATGKSGPLLSLPLELILLRAGQDSAARSARACGEAFAIGYQIYDDLRDLKADSIKGTLNIVNLLESSGSPQASSQASSLAISWFARSIHHAEQLPDTIAELIVVASKQLASRLEPMRVPCRS